MRLQVTAPARLHFGLMQIDPSQPHCFGGLGLMLPQPAVRLTAAASDAFRVAIHDGEIGRRVTAASESAAEFLHLPSLPTVEISLAGPIKLHSGLGVGTQLACAAATLVAAIAIESGPRDNSPQPAAGSIPAEEIWRRTLELHDVQVPRGVRDASGGDGADAIHAALAAAGGRGKRSHVGIRGFLRGGFLRDSGTSFGDARGVARRVESLPMPSGWRTVLLISRNGQGPSGAVEQQAFDRSRRSSQSPDLRGLFEKLKRLADESIVPNLLYERFDNFSRSLAEYNDLAGQLFDADAVADSSHVDQITQGRRVLSQHGFTAAGQSSWGPTLWAMTESPESIDAASLQKSLDEARCDYDALIIDQPSGGAVVASTGSREEANLDEYRQ